MPRGSRVAGAVAALAACAGIAASACATSRPGEPGGYDGDARLDVTEGKPGGGLAFRLTTSTAATPERPARLLVWLHPSGGSFNSEVEALAPDLAERGYALLVVTEGPFDSWRGADVGRLVRGTLPAVAAMPCLDARHPVLLGFSAGGQVALLLWRQDPRWMGGLALVAAQPVVPGEGGVAVPLEPPPGSAATPILVFIGAEESGVVRWREAAPRWRGAGVPLTVREVAGRGHEWLLDGAERQALLGWLERLPAPVVDPDRPAVSPPASTASTGSAG
jgi:predicted esterase